MTFDIWQGKKTIGGNIVEVKGELGRVICDFGITGIDLSLNQSTEEVLANNLFPKIPYLFDTRNMTEVDLEDYRDDTLETAIFISHLHIDHMGGLRYLPDNTTCYLSQSSYDLYKILMDSGEEKRVNLDFQVLVPSEPVTVGDITVTPYESDHDILGTMSLFIESPTEKIIHSGDVRLTGMTPEKVWHWIEVAKLWEPDYLFIEGTSFSFKDEFQQLTPITEEDLKEKWARLLEEQESLLVINPYMRNMERIKQLKEVTEQIGKTFVLEENYAKAYMSLFPNESVTVLTDDLVTEWPPSKCVKFADLRTIKQNPTHFVLQNDFKALDRLKELTPFRYFHSNGEPLGEYDSRYKELIDYLLELDVEMEFLSASGHAKQADLLTIIQEIQPKETIAWHSFYPELLEEQLEALGQSVFRDS